MSGGDMAQRKKSVAYVLNGSAPSFRNRLFMASLKNLGYEPILIVRHQTEGAVESIKKSNSQGVTVYTLSSSSGKGAGKRHGRLLRKVLAGLEHSLERLYLTHLSQLRAFAFSGRRKYKLAYDATETSLPALDIKLRPLSIIAERMLEMLERRFVRMAKVDTLTLSGARAAGLSQFRKACSNSSVVQTMPAMAQSAREEDLQEARKKIGNKRVVAALGGLRSTGELEYALEVAKNVIEAYGDVLFLFFGETSADNKVLKNMVASRNLEGRVHFLGEMPYRKMMSYLESSHVGLALDTGSGITVTTGDKSMRMFSYMQAGLPIVGPAFCQGGAVAREAGCGLFVDTSSPVEVAGSVAYLLTNPDKASEHGQRGRKAFRGRYNWDMERQNLISLFGEA